MLNLQNLKRIPTPEEYELEKAYEALRLNGVPMYVPKVLSASSIKKKPAFRIKRMGSGKLQSGSTIWRQILEQERENAEKALRLNGV